MNPRLVKLTIIASAALENTLVESLLEMEPSMGAFTTMRVDGHGQSFAVASTAERVSGRAARLMVVAVLSAGQANIVIEHLRTSIGMPHAAWWTEPVLDFGKFQ